MTMLLHSIQRDILSKTGLPKKMNNPLFYEPHPLCLAVCEELQACLMGKTGWRAEIDRGKMFGVLIVEVPSLGAASYGESKVGYLAAYSGQIGGRSDWEGFVPAVFDYLQPEGYFKSHEAEITCINQDIRKMENDGRMAAAREAIARLRQVRRQTIERHQQMMREAKERRNVRREEALQDPVHKAIPEEEKLTMTRESQFLRAELRRLKKKLAEKTPIEKEYDDWQEDIRWLKRLRRELSDSLQQWLFRQFGMLNWKGETKDLLEIFREAASMAVPPAGSGECCEPKLLQYAYSHGYRPLQIAMFWWGESPREEVRHHLHFYPACNGKCKPILQWMLPAEVFCASGSRIQEVETLYEDCEVAVVHKPEGLLSVPGKDSTAPSVYSLVRRIYPDATGPLVVHRLDMATSGLLVIAKTEFAYRRLQDQFAHHRVHKKYVAIVCCKSKDACDRLPERARISLPLMPDYLDRPRQIVHYGMGKESITHYEVVERVDDTHLRLALYPETGRTHQLRVHCAHHEGLDAPILGDPLYGNEKASRLYLHAEEITFEHPLTEKSITVRREADF